MNTPKRILVVEDNTTYRKMLKIRLKSEGYKIITAENGLEGLDKARREKPDLIILDLMLPRIDGHQVCRFIKFDKNIRDTPIVVLTCRNLSEDVELAIKEHVDAFIIKGTRIEILLNVMKRLLDSRGAP